MACFAGSVKKCFWFCFGENFSKKKKKKTSFAWSVFKSDIFHLYVLRGLPSKIIFFFSLLIWFHLHSQLMLEIRIRISPLPVIFAATWRWTGVPHHGACQTVIIAFRRLILEFNWLVFFNNNKAAGMWIRSILNIFSPRYYDTKHLRPVCPTGSDESRQPERFIL